MFNLASIEKRVFKRLSTPQKVQDFLTALPVNFEKKGETHYSPRRVLREKKAHCIEGAMLAAAAFWFHGGEPLLMDFTTRADDEDHVIAPFKQNGYWGAISKTNHAILRYRDPIYKTLRELALSYFHEYYMFENGEKTLVSYSRPLNLKRFGTNWITDEKDLWYMDDALDAMPHFSLVPKVNKKLLRRADSIELKVGSITEWKRD
ncbi:MAG: hypothetical protein HYT30_00915 [Parcubacteria group bacterium]|nr:hypothetical protein [Parcubacteria group bacterium]